jgi:amino acid transporter
MGGIAMLFCFFKLADVIAALVVIRIIVQFLAQIIGLLVLRATKPEMPRPFRMWLYPVPALIAIAGFLFVLFSRKDFEREVRYAAVLIVAGVLVFLLRSYRRKEFPFGDKVVVNEA